MFLIKITNKNGHNECIMTNHPDLFVRGNLFASIFLKYKIKKSGGEFKIRVLLAHTEISESG